MDKFKKLFKVTLVLCLFFGIYQNHYAQVLEQDSLALVAFYESTNGDNWINNTNWLSADSGLSTWYGITVSEERITQINLNDNNLVGTIPSSIGDLDSLKYLDLSYNQLISSIPTEIGYLEKLEHLGLFFNQLTGSVPSSISNLTKLPGLYLYQNQLTGTIPAEIWEMTNLEMLLLDGNQLSGTIPNAIRNLASLTILHLSGNQLSGSIPAAIGSLEKLTRIWISNNHFSGPIPPEIVLLQKLYYLRITDNKLTDLPDLSSLNSLNELKTENNKFSFEDIEPNIGIADSLFTYSPQDSIGVGTDTTVIAGTNFTLSVFVGGANNLYQWTKNGVEIPGANESNYTIDSLAGSDAGSYLCQITNTTATDLTLCSRVIHVNVDETVGIRDQSSIAPSVYELNQNYPNPFNPSTTISYSIPNSAFVSIKIYDLLGNEIEVLIGEYQNAGSYTITYHPQNLSSGIYLYRITANNFVATKKLLLVK